MKAQLYTYYGETLVQVKNIIVDDNYKEENGPYVKEVPFCVGSNQQVISSEHLFKEEFDNS